MTRASKPTSIGPANDLREYTDGMQYGRDLLFDLVRFLYILEQQNQSDTNEIRTQAREDVLNYLNPHRTSEGVDEDEDEHEEEEEEEEDEQEEQSDDQQQVIAPPFNPVRRFCYTESLSHFFH